MVAQTLPRALSEPCLASDLTCTQPFSPHLFHLYALPMSDKQTTLS